METNIQPLKSNTTLIFNHHQMDLSDAEQELTKNINHSIKQFFNIYAPKQSVLIDVQLKNNEQSKSNTSSLLFQISIKSSQTKAEKSIAKIKNPCDKKPIKLTHRESEVLQLIVKGLSYNDIARTLVMSTHTVTTHTKNIYKKLSVHSRGEAAFEAQQLGLFNQL